MIGRICLGMLLVVVPSAPPYVYLAGATAMAQSPNSDEQAIRDLVRRGDAGERPAQTTNSILASGLAPQSLAQGRRRMASRSNGR